MIVIAIIAILALIAVPNFSDKFVREQIIDAVKLADIAKAPIAPQWAPSGTMPVDNGAAGLPSAVMIVNNFISAVAVESGAIQITFGNHANPAIQGKVLSMRPGRDRQLDAGAGGVGLRLLGAAGQHDGQGPEQDQCRAHLPAAELQVDGAAAVRLGLDGVMTS